MATRWLRGMMAAVVGVALLAGAGTVCAQDAKTQALLEKYRADFNAAKKQTIDEVMKLNEGEAKKFWPIYDDYTKKLNAYSDKRLKFANDFTIAQSATTFDPDQAKQLTQRWLKLQHDRINLWETYAGKIGRAVSPVRAAQFLQIENEIATVLDLNVLSNAPLVGQP
jgi:DNA-binding GntR family transcriptional regulator